MTNEEFVIKFYELNLEAMREALNIDRWFLTPWKDLAEDSVSHWLKLIPYRKILVSAADVQTFLEILFRAYGKPVPTYITNSGQPADRYYETLYQKITQFDWTAANMGAPTGELAPSVYLLKASSLKFMIQGWIEMDGQPKKVAIKFLHNGATGEIVQDEFNNVAVKLDP